MQESGTTATLVVAARDGDAAAVRCLYVRFARVVHGVLLGYVQHADADDLTQDVFQTALQRLPELREPAAFPGWLLRIARNAALNRLRQARPAEVVADAMLVDGSAGPDARLEAQHALAAIRALPGAYRETLMLRLVEGLSGPEISERTGLTPGTVRVNLHRGMGLLRRALGIGAAREVET